MQIIVNIPAESKQADSTPDEIMHIKLVEKLVTYNGYVPSIWEREHGILESSGRKCTLRAWITGQDL